MASPAQTREPRAIRLARDVHVNVLLLAGRSTEDLEAICNRHGLTHQQYVTMWTLCLADDPDAGVPIGAVADGLLTRASDTTRLIDRLERAGFVERRPNPHDRRSVLVRATEAGSAAFAAATPEIQAYHRRQWDHLDEDEVVQLHDLLAKALWGGTTPVPGMADPGRPA